MEKNQPILMMMRQLSKQFVLLLGIFLCLTTATARAESETPSLESLPVGIINQTISVPFKPASSYALVEAGDGTVKQYRAMAIPNPDSTNADGNQTYAIAAVVPLDLVRPNADIRFTFFLASIQGDFAATEVMQWTANELREESVSLGSLQSMIGFYEKNLPQAQIDNANMENQLSGLREKASQIADVDDIIDLKAELESLKDFDEKKLGELERLHGLAAQGRALPDPPQAATLRQELSEQLFEAAKVTAFADRISNAKRDMALTTYRRKVNLVKAAEGVDPEALAQEALRLRKKRKELERRLNIDTEAGEIAPDQF